MPKIMRAPARRIGVDQHANFEERRLIILREAAKMYIEEGFLRPSMADLAKRLSVTKATLYHYVSGKNEIISRCLDIGQERERIRIETAHSNYTRGIDKLRFILRSNSASVIDEFGAFVTLLETSALNEESRQKHLELQRTYYREIEKVIQQGIADGSIRACNAKMLSFLLISAFTSFAKWFNVDGPLTFDVAIAQALDLVESGYAKKRNIRRDFPT